MLEITCETDDENVSMLREKSGAENRCGPTYHAPVTAAVSMSRKTLAHFWPFTEYDAPVSRTHSDDPVASRIA